MYFVLDPKSHAGPLVVIIPTIERIPGDVLRDLIQIAALYVKKDRHSLPISFIFGLSSTEDLGLEAQCDASSLVNLSIKRFQMQPPSAFLNIVFTEVLIAFFFIFYSTQFLQGLFFLLFSCSTLRDIVHRV